MGGRASDSAGTATTATKEKRTVFIMKNGVKQGKTGLKHLEKSRSILLLYVYKWVTI
jgi:hypothetical protein